MRKPVIAANWKMYKTPAEAESFITAFLPLMRGQNKSEVVLCPATPDLTFVVKGVEGSSIRVGAQNMHFAEEGAYTGENSATMLTALGVTHVILGHSERRQYFAETDETVHQKLITALKHRLTPIVCIGERLEEREGGKTEEVLLRQITAALGKIDPAQLAPVIVAYEPVWAIGTGKTATPEMAADAHHLIREEAARVAGKAFANELRILYGGSVKPENAAALLREHDIDGALVGGASLDPQSFAKIVDAA